MFHKNLLIATLILLLAFNLNAAPSTNDTSLKVDPRCQRRLVVTALSICGEIECDQDAPRFGCNPMPSEEQIKSRCCPN